LAHGVLHLAFCAVVGPPHLHPNHLQHRYAAERAIFFCMPAIAFCMPGWPPPPAIAPREFVHVLLVESAQTPGARTSAESHMENSHLHLHSPLAIIGLSIAMVISTSDCVEAVDVCAPGRSPDGRSWHSTPADFNVLSHIAELITV